MLPIDVTCKLKCFTQMIKYWHNITEVDHSTLVYKTLSLLPEGEAKGQHNWPLSVKVCTKILN